MNNINKIKPIPPFKSFVLENFPFIEEDFDALTNYELLCHVVNYVKTMGNEFNDIIIKVEELENWFNNLDVQDEIDNKLDQMVEDGTLQEIIADYLNSKAVFGFDNVESMKNATNLINGSYVKTLGFYSKGDKGEALYKVRTITNEDIVDEMTIIALNDENLIAELIIEDTMNINQFGASHNITNNQPYIEKAIQKCGTLILNNEQYNITSPILIDKPIRIIGNNNSRNLNVPTIYGENISEIINITPLTTGVILENFNLKSNYTRESSINTNGIYCSNNTYHLTFKNIQISNCKNGILVSRTWNMLFENCIFDTCDNGFNSSDTVTSTSFISCLVYNSHYGWYIRGGFVYSAFYSCGTDHTDMSIRCEGSGSIDTYNFGAEDYQRVYSIASNNTGIKLNAHNTFFYPSERITGDVLFQGNECNFYDTTFPTGSSVSSSVPVRYLNCSNVPSTTTTILNTNPVGYIEKQSNGLYGYMNGFRQQNANSTITLNRDNSSDNCWIIGNLIVGNNTKVCNVLISSLNTNHVLDGVDTDLLSITFDNYNMTITFLVDCFIDINLKYRNYK